MRESESGRERGESEQGGERVRGVRHQEGQEREGKEGKLGGEGAEGGKRKWNEESERGEGEGERMREKKG